jgi:hypothetical protein
MAGMKPIIPMILAAMLAALAGCLPVSQNPLSSPDTAKPDARLAGLWYGKSGEDTVFLHFVPTDGAKMDIVEVDHEKQHGASTNIYTMFPSVIDDYRYLNVQEKKGSNKSWYLARYRIGGSGDLTIWFLSEKPVAKAVKAEKLAGKIVEKEPVNGVLANREITVTASTEKLAAYVRKCDPEILFAEKFGTFKKVTLPAIEAAPTPEPASGKPVQKKKKKTSAE